MDFLFFFLSFKAYLCLYSVLQFFSSFFERNWYFRYKTCILHRYLHVFLFLALSLFFSSFLFFTRVQITWLLTLSLGDVTCMLLYICVFYFYETRYTKQLNTSRIKTIVISYEYVTRKYNICRHLYRRFRSSLSARKGVLSTGPIEKARSIHRVKFALPTTRVWL